MTKKSTKKADTVESATIKTTGSTRTRKTSEVKTKSVKVSINEILVTRLRLKCKNVKQKEFTALIDTKEIVIASGPAGVGKSYVAIAKAIELLQTDSDKYTKLVIIKPAVESEEDYGFLPGTLKDKMEPHVASSIDIVDKLIGETARINLEESNIIKVEPLGFIRGKSIDNSIVIIEEAQNLSPNQMKTILTRIGENTKFVISGDLDQSDKYQDVRNSGLFDAMTRHKNVPEVGFYEFSDEDVVRNPLIIKLLKNYAKVSLIPEVKEAVIIKPNVKKEITVVKNKKEKSNWFTKFFKW